MGLCDYDTEFTGVLSWLMIDYLYTNHGNIEYEDVVTNKHFLANPLDPTQPIFNIFNQHKDIITIYTKGGKPISSQYIILSAYVLLKTSGACDIDPNDPGAPTILSAVILTVNMKNIIHIH